MVNKVKKQTESAFFTSAKIEASNNNIWGFFICLLKQGVDATGCFNDSMNATEKILKAYTINKNKI